MSVVRWSVSLVAIIGLMAATIAGATIWLLADRSRPRGRGQRQAASGRTSARSCAAIGDVIVGALQGLFKYL